MPGVLLRALGEYKFVGTPLWRMSDGKDLVRVELTFHKALPTKPYYKRRAESRRQPAPSAGEWPRQPVPASRPPPRREPTQIERETLPPTTQTIEQTSQQIIRPRYKKTASITASPIITRPAPAPASPESPPSKKPRKKSPEPAKDRPTLCCYDAYEEPFPIHEKYDLQDALSNKLHGKNVAIIKAQRLLREEEEMNIDLPAYFLHRPWKQDWLFIKGPTSKYYHEEFYNKMEELAESGKSQSNIISWFCFVERACSDPSGKYRYVRVAPR